MEKEKLMRYGYVIERSKTGFSAYVPDLPGCIATGRTKAVVHRRVEEAVRIHLESMMAGGDPIPEPSQWGFLDVRLAS